MRYRIISGIDHHIVTAAFATQFQSEILIISHIIEYVVIYIFHWHPDKLSLNLSTGEAIIMYRSSGCRSFKMKITGFEIIIVQIESVKLIPFYSEILKEIAILHKPSCCKFGIVNAVNTTG